MAKTIFKYHLGDSINKIHTIQLPVGAKILDAQNQNGAFVIWALVESNATVEDRHFKLIWTGLEIPDEDFKYISTIQSTGGALVYHLFEVSI